LSLPKSEQGDINDSNLSLNPDLHVTHATPPTLLLQAEDDHVDSVYDSLYIALQRAGVSVEMHLYPSAGHAFGLRRTKNAVANWPALVDEWLITIGMLAR
jgi:acetyl esterase/lipase